MTKLKLNPFENVALALGLFYLFYFAMVGVHVIFMPKVLKDIGYSSVEIGAIYTSAPLMRFLLPFIFKKWINLTHRVFFISLIATFFITLIFFITINSFWLLLLVSLIYGGAMGAALPFVETIAIEQIGKERYGKIRLWGSVGFSIVAFVLGNILNSYIVALVSLSLMALFTMLTGFVLAKFDKDSTKEQIQEDSSSFSLSKYWAFWVSIFLFQFSFGGFYNFFTIYETSNALALDIVSYLWIFGVVCEIVMLVFQGPLLANFNLLTLLLISTLSGAVRWLLVAQYPANLNIIMFSQGLHALSFALYYTAAIAYVYKLYTQKRLAQQFFLGISFGLGGAVGAVVSGVIYKISASGLFMFEAFIALLSAVLLIIHKIRREYVD
jgi:PPP family 3-phenylpropionic acid transporter